MGPEWELFLAQEVQQKKQILKQFKNRKLEKPTQVANPGCNPGDVWLEDDDGPILTVEARVFTFQKGKLNGDIWEEVS